MSALLMAVFLGMVAFAVDLGYLTLVRTELQRSADAAALAGATALYPIDDSREFYSYYLNPDTYAAREKASEYVRRNGAGKYRKSAIDGRFLQVERNDANALGGDIVLGRIYNPANLSEQLKPDDLHPNSVQVHIRMTEDSGNGTNLLFFAPVLGVMTAGAGATATAVVDYPSLLPVTTSEWKWKSLESSGDGDQYSYQPGSVTSGADQIPEIQIFPDNNWKESDGMPPGNFGALEIGGVQGTEILRRQIDMGPSPEDIDFHGGSLYKGMPISGKTGVNGDITTAFNGGNADDREYAGILGKIRYLPIYSNVTGNGDNAVFTISKFVAVRVMHVKMTGNPKYIVVQPVSESERILNLNLCR